MKMSDMEKLVIAVMDSDSSVMNKVLREVPQCSDMSRDLAIYSAKNNYNNFLISMSEDEKISNIVRMECLDHTRDTYTRLQLMRDIFSYLCDRKDIYTEIDKSLDAITPHLLELSLIMKKEETLDEALSVIDEEFD